MSRYSGLNPKPSGGYFLGSKGITNFNQGFPEYGFVIVGYCPRPSDLFIMSIEEWMRFTEFMKMDASQFNGDPSADAYEFLISYHEILYTLGL
ncbi:hypothetical protein HAX54_006934, partial [Datura stramonium]|nr:hypothetical protein [Datura stramonium]